jgi:hypothetical protein
LELDRQNRVANDYYEKVKNLLKADQKPIDTKNGLVPKRKEPPSQYQLVHRK